MTPACKTWNTSARLAKCGVVSPGSPDGERPSTLAILQPVFSELWGIYDRYIAQTRPMDVPWWYTERTIVGHLTAAAFRAGYSALEEYSCEKGKNHSKGRVDWWLGTPDGKRDVFVESKQEYLSAHTDWARVESRFGEAERQIVEYHLETDSEESYKLAMVFVRPYYQTPREWEERRQRLLDGAEYPGNAHYYAYYWLEESDVAGCECNKYYYPGLFICCRQL
ncbi:MAG: hypothetical protein WBE26_02435 [Phycisphaerae bacterium]